MAGTDPYTKAVTEFVRLQREVAASLVRAGAALPGEECLTRAAAMARGILASRHERKTKLLTQDNVVHLNGQPSDD